MKTSYRTHQALVDSELPCQKLPSQFVGIYQQGLSLLSIYEPLVELPRKLLPGQLIRQVIQQLYLQSLVVVYSCTNLTTG